MDGGAVHSAVGFGRGRHVTLTITVAASWHDKQCRIEAGAIDAAALGPFKK